MYVVICVRVYVYVDYMYVGGYMLYVCTVRLFLSVRQLRMAVCNARAQTRSLRTVVCTATVRTRPHLSVVCTARAQTRRFRTVVCTANVQTRALRTVVCTANVQTRSRLLGHFYDAQLDGSHGLCGRDTTFRLWFSKIGTQIRVSDTIFLKKTRK